MANWFINLTDTAFHATKLTNNTLKRLSVNLLAMADFRLHYLHNRNSIQLYFEISKNCSQGTPVPTHRHRSCQNQTKSPSYRVVHLQRKNLKIPVELCLILQILKNLLYTVDKQRKLVLFWIVYVINRVWRVSTFITHATLGNLSFLYNHNKPTRQHNTKAIRQGAFPYWNFCRPAVYNCVKSSHNVKFQAIKLQPEKHLVTF